MKDVGKLGKKQSHLTSKLDSSSVSGSTESGKQTKAPGASSTKVAVPVPPGNINSEVLFILKELNNKFNKQGSKIETLAKRVDELYECETYENQETEPPYSSYQYSEPDEYSYTNTQYEDDSVSSEPPQKKSCLENDKFKDLCDKYQIAEKCDHEINDNLAAFINSSFRNGIPEETLTEMLKDIHRPQNCEALVKTKVNPCIWRLLKPQTQIEDVKFQTLQNVLVKASVNLAKLLDKESEALDSQSMEWCKNALALLGQSYKLINNKGKECHRSDLDPRFYPLTSSSLPYTDNLHGDDINKNVRDIQDLSKLGKDIGRNQQTQGRGFY